METWTDELIRHARAEAATPEGRARVVAALRETLAAVEGMRVAAQATPDGVAEALDGLSESLICACEHAALLQEVFTPAPRR
ncbi:hypothetical protein [Phenylobacterium sp.]|uniref:hypothetical protein n=1 Tax=Phenylobacterium sp. TaxID=1871053 RepID=UPI0025F02AD5|nr:hypothetical protein [Phenylobacterium sp.]MBX3482512.1 hypothetical protein [Phenylobacterium sp.]MCW5758259.1 hypothetical protein [Phenylobacterium sp.]